MAAAISGTTFSAMNLASSGFSRRSTWSKLAPSWAPRDMFVPDAAVHGLGSRIGGSSVIG
jgi:hypothetical protein